jgi:hypothetical protein
MPEPAEENPMTDQITPFKGSRETPQSKQDFWKKIDDAIANLGDVTVATLLTDIRASVDEDGRLDGVSIDADKPFPAIISNVNLINGNVTTVLGPTLKEDTTLTTFHNGLVDKAVKVLPDNLKALAGLVENFFKKG